MDKLEKILNEGGFETQRIDRASVRQGATWECKIGLTDEKSTVLKGGADFPMRKAIEDEFVRQTGLHPDFLISGWGANLMPEGSASKVSIVGYYGENAHPVTLILSDGSELEFDPDQFPNNSA